MGKINAESIPDLTIYLIASSLEKTILDYFKDPVHVKEYKKWKKERKTEVAPVQQEGVIKNAI